MCVCVCRRVAVERSFNEATFEKGFHPMKSTIKKTWYKSFIPPEPIKSSLLPPSTRRAWKSFLFTRLPILSWIWSYQTKNIVGDLVSGFTVAIMHIPQGNQLSRCYPLTGVINRSGIWSIDWSTCSVWTLLLIHSCHSLCNIRYIKASICW